MPGPDGVVSTGSQTSGPTVSGGSQTSPALVLGGRQATAPIHTNWDAVAPPSGGGSGGNYTHTQSDPASVVTISHNLGFRPAGVALFSLDYGITYRGFGVQHLSDNVLRVSMDKPTACVVVLS